MSDLIKRTKEKIVSGLELPEEVLLKYSHITIISNVKIEIENHTGVVLFTSNEVRINTTENMIIIQGESLYIDDLMSEEITVKGKINTIKFLS